MLDIGILLVYVSCGGHLHVLCKILGKYKVVRFLDVLSNVFGVICPSALLLLHWTVSLVGAIFHFFFSFSITCILLLPSQVPIMVLLCFPGAYV